MRVGPWVRIRCEASGLSSLTEATVGFHGDMQTSVFRMLTRFGLLGLLLMPAHLLF